MKRPKVILNVFSSIDGVMTQYSLLDRRPEEEILDLLHENNISVLVRGPLAKGMLSNRANEQIIKKGKDGYLDYTYEELMNIYEKLTSLTDNMNELALQYVLQQPAVASAVFGASSIDQIKENTLVHLDEVLSDKIYKQLKASTIENKYVQHR